MAAREMRMKVRLDARTILRFAAIVAFFAASAHARAATVATDQLDYSPGEIVIVTGAGWEASETVSLYIEEDPIIHPAQTLYATADVDGNIYNGEYVIQDHDIGQTFTLTGTGQSSGLTAQTTFTDGLCGDGGVHNRG